MIARLPIWECITLAIAIGVPCGLAVVGAGWLLFQAVEEILR